MIRRIKNLLLKNHYLRLKMFYFVTCRDYKRLCKKNKYTITKEEKKEIKEYWNKYKKNINLYSHILYYNINFKDPKYIPDYMYYKYIDPYFNNMKFAAFAEDKNYYDVWFKDLNRPKTIIHNIGGIFYNNEYEIIDKNEALEIIKKQLKKEKVVIKPTIYTSSGSNVVIIDKDTNIFKVFDDYKKDFIVQGFIHQHEYLSKIHAESVNTIRVVSIIWKDEVRVVSTILRMGRGNNWVDNSNCGGLHVGINSDGTFGKVAYDKDSNVYHKHPGGFVFEGSKLPHYDKVVETVKKAHQKLSYFRLIHWDFTIDKDGNPMFVEANIGRGGVFLLQYTNGPIFGELTDEILEEVFNHKNK